MFQELEKCLQKLNDLALNPYNFQLIIKMYDNLIRQEEELENSNKIEKEKEKEQLDNCSIF